jgi:hypothetical protein
MTSGRNFDKYGFIKLRLTPVVLDESVMTPEDSSFVYTHYPQLPDVMNGLERRFLGFSDIVQFRFVALAFSFASLFFVYGLVSTYWSRRAGQLALVFWVVNPLWLQHADYLHHAPYAAFFGFGSVYFLTRYLREESRRGYLAASGTFLFFTFLSSYDFWLFIPLLLAMVTVRHYGGVLRTPVWRTLGILAGCAVLALLCKWGTNAWGLGGVGPFWRDLKFQFTERATDDITRSSWIGGMWTTTYGRVERCFSVLLFPVTAFLFVLPLIRRRWGTTWPALQRVGPNPLWLIAAALPFLFIFTELFIGQYYPTLLILPFYAVACAVTVSLFLDAGRYSRLLGVALVVALLGNALGEIVTFKKAFLSREMIRTLGPQLASVMRPKQQLLSNHVFDAAYRYYFNHNTYALILSPPGKTDVVLSYYSSPKRTRFADANGAIFIQHKHLSDQMFDKGYYYIFARYHLWSEWANPTLHRRFIDSLITDRDSTLMANVARVGEKLYETDSYALWRIRPSWTGPMLQR